MTRTPNPLLVLFSMMLMLSSCGVKNNSVVTFDNDFEGLKGWCTVANLFEGKGHSGRFSTVADSTSPYASIFRIRLKDIDPKPLNYLRFSVWCYSEAPTGAAQLVSSIDSDTVQSLVWHGWLLSDYMATVGKWTEITGELNLAENGANNPENIFVFYLWNNGSSAIWGDDFHFEFSNN